MLSQLSASQLDRLASEAQASVLQSEIGMHRRRLDEKESALTAERGRIAQLELEMEDMRQKEEHYHWDDTDEDQYPFHSKAQRNFVDSSTGQVLDPTKVGQGRQRNLST